VTVLPKAQPAIIVWDDLRDSLHELRREHPDCTFLEDSTVVQSTKVLAKDPFRKKHGLRDTRLRDLR
jgi:hypothetical protein